eukprot:1035810-Ditylum_brightwellii.AAC.1
MLVTPEGHVSKRKKGRAVVIPSHNTTILAVAVEAGRIAAAGHHKGAVEVMVIRIATATVTTTIITLGDRIITIVVETATETAATIITTVTGDVMVAVEAVTTTIVMPNAPMIGTGVEAMYTMSPRKLLAPVAVLVVAAVIAVTALAIHQAAAAAVIAATPL